VWHTCFLSIFTHTVPGIVTHTVPVEMNESPAWKWRRFNTPKNDRCGY
jgi:hypothetical protein